MKWIHGLTITTILAASSLAIAQGARGGRGRGTAAAPAAGGTAPVPAAGRAGAGRGGAAAQALPALNLAFYSAQFDTMTAELTLTDDQKTKVHDKVDTMNKEIDTFMAGAPAQIAAARGGRGARGGAGRAGRGAAAVQPPAPGATTATGMLVQGQAGMNPAVIKLQDDLQALINEHQILINKELTPDQRLTWETYKLNRTLDQRAALLGLTDDQRDKVKPLVEDSAKALAALTDGKMVQDIQGKLFRKIVSDILTDAQIGKLLEGTLAVQPGAGRGGRGAAAGAALQQ
ncbi:MAG TPA: hypothetical protein VGN88_09640 [Phycisphaerae bacterium]|jgi:hypothetical protein